ncbi:SPOR domain-containing protein [Variovorax sp. PCZ-1]|uniref:SPOR domain-containing protein n=1 Tax=Variovorax sp. PCZ-1 TaxID=2835533 RepID=UPI001BCAAEDE|nr:SPOR domain-containing protein [Variovorax sp. PCZ-1]MBS7805981.1 SPOR domain-containing protein [Variovorax sp. PCZ-1]
MNNLSSPQARSQRGGTFLGVVLGLMLGLGAALAVAIYVTKVPIPFTNKGATKNSAEQDAQESQKNKNWDPNAPLYGKNPAKPSASGTVGTATMATAPTAAASAPKAAASAPKAAASAPKTAASAPKSSADPLGDLAKAKTAGTATAAVSGADPFTYFVQAGAFRTSEDAEAQKAKLSMAGFQANITEREQSGRTVFRVRVGPMDKKDEADKTKEKLDGAGFETAIVRIQR